MKRHIKVCGRDGKRWAMFVATDLLIGETNRRNQLTAADLHGNLVLVCAQVRNREEGRDLVLGRSDLLKTHNARVSHTRVSHTHKS